MANKPLSRYSLEEVTLVIGGYDISGGSEGDFISIERKEVGTYVTDASGQSVFNVNTDYSAEVTITVMQTSPAMRSLAAILADQNAATGSGGNMPDLSFRIYDPNSGAYVQDRQCAILEAPGHSFGKEATEMEWKFLLPNAYRPGNFAYAPNIT